MTTVQNLSAIIKNTKIAEPTSHMGDFTGWVSLSGIAADGTTYGVTYDPATDSFGGYAWGGSVAGWVSFSGTTREPPYDPYAVTTVAPFPQADLTIPQPPSAANPLITGGSIEFDAVINNIGTADAFASFEISFDIDLDSPVFTASDVQLTPNPSLPNLNPGGSQNVTSSAWTAALGIHTLRVCADTSTPGSVTESNETNNCIDWQFEAKIGR